MPKIIVNNTINLLSLTAISILGISNHNSFRVLFDKNASVYFILKIYLYFSVGNGHPREPAPCQLYRQFHSQCAASYDGPFLVCTAESNQIRAVPLASLRALFASPIPSPLRADMTSSMHKTGSTQRIAMPLKKATYTENMWSLDMWFVRFASGQTYRQTQTDTLHYLRSPILGKGKVWGR